VEKRIRLLNVILVFGIIAILLVFIPLPYYVTKPGLAEDLRPYVKVENGDQDPGEFMLTTVSMSRANFYSYVGTFVNSVHHLYKEEEIMVKGESNEDYEFRQLRYMEESKHAAILNAYKAAGKPYEIKKNGIMVVSIIKDMPAYELLKLGDIITRVDSKDVNSVEDFSSIVSKVKPGEKINLEFNRKGKIKNITITTKPFKNEPSRSGIGVSIVEDINLITQPKVTINSEEIGGPSAGLMFALEVYDQLKDENLTKGYDIAGTGTIDEKGEVGPIGGISQKIIAASKADAEIFLAPAENGKKNSNYNEAVKTAKDHNLKLKIIPINTYEEALTYLKKLKEKK
jgi:Lon-like protease